MADTVFEYYVQNRAVKTVNNRFLCFFPYLLLILVMRFTSDQDTEESDISAVLYTGTKFNDMLKRKVQGKTNHKLYRKIDGRVLSV